MEIGVANTHFLNSTKIAFQVVAGLEHFGKKNTLFSFKKGRSAKITERIRFHYGQSF